MHTHYTTYTGAAFYPHYECDTCGRAYTFKSEYFAKQWAEQHSTGRRETLHGVVETWLE